MFMFHVVDHVQRRSHGQKSGDEGERLSGQKVNDCAQHRQGQGHHDHVRHVGRRHGPVSGHRGVQPFHPFGHVIKNLVFFGSVDHGLDAGIDPFGHLVHKDFEQC